MPGAIPGLAARQSTDCVKGGGSKVPSRLESKDMLALVTGHHVPAPPSLLSLPPPLTVTDVFSRARDSTRAGWRR
eukprot:180740-Rhodomonas_salina.1